MSRSHYLTRLALACMKLSACLPNADRSSLAGKHVTTALTLGFSTMVPIYIFVGSSDFGDDCVRETPITKEAIRRLPKQIQDERNYRSLRAIQADINKQILPKEQWTKPEEEVDYLTPYIKQVEAEEAEKKEWYRTH